MDTSFPPSVGCVHPDPVVRDAIAIPAWCRRESVDPRSLALMGEREMGALPIGALAIALAVIARQEQPGLVGLTPPLPRFP